jgi:hypothetical protein
MMSPTIRIDEDVYEALQKRAQPFVDTPNSVLRRILELEGSGQSAGPAPQGQTRRRAGRPTAESWPPRAQSGDLLDAAEYRGPILRALAARGGSARSKEVVDAVGHELEDRLTPTDRGTLASGDIRWRNRVMWARFHLAKSGLIDKEAPRGLWSLTEAGRRAAKSA